jgi:hypothetical protein
VSRIVLATGLLLVGGCGHLPDAPTPPSPAPEPPGGPVPVPPPSAQAPRPAPVLGAPAADPSPTPEPDATPSPEPTPTPPPAARGCSEPYPPDLSRINVKVHTRGAEFWTIDSTPLVGPDAAYCQKIGFSDGRLYCPVRQEGDPQRTACEAYVVGIAADTGRAGPTWTRDGHSCTGPTSGCENSPDNQYQVRAYLGGTYRACAANGVCGEEIVDR